MNDSGTFNAAAFAAGLVRNRYDPGLTPGVPKSRISGGSGYARRGAVFLWRSNAFRNGCFLFAAFAAGLARNRNDPGLTPGATRGRCVAAL